MKKETFEKGNDLLEDTNKLQRIIESIAVDRAQYYDNSNRGIYHNGNHILNMIKIRSVSPKRGDSDMDEICINFDNKEGFANIDNKTKLSEKAASLLQYLSIAFRDAVVNVLLNEEKSLLKEFETLKDE